MATWYSNTAGLNSSPRSGNPGIVSQAFSFSFVNTSAATYPAVNEVLILAKLPKFSTLLGFVVDLPDQGAAAIVDIGTLSNTTRFATGVNTNAGNGRFSTFDISQTAAVGATAGSVPFQVLNTTANANTVDDDIRITWTTAATTPLNNTIKGFVLYTMDEPYAEVD